MISFANFVDLQQVVVKVEKVYGGEIFDSSELDC